MTDHASEPGGQPESRRAFLYLTVGAFGSVGTALALWPFIHSMNPSADVLALSTIEVDISPIEVGQSITVIWQKKPVFIRRRTAEEIDIAEKTPATDLPDPQTDADRVIKPEWLVVIGVCTHLGCIPLGQRPTEPRGDWNGWFCPCHGSHYDTSGRIRKGPAPENLWVPKYEYLDDTTIKIG
jgi:ubiquinol-cytochrome c reductase iron-sulfur subunit